MENWRVGATRDLWWNHLLSDLSTFVGLVLLVVPPVLQLFLHLEELIVRVLAKGAICLPRNCPWNGVIVLDVDGSTQVALVLL